MTNQPTQNPPPGDEEWVNLKYKMNVELLTATEDEGESTKAEKGGGGGLGDGGHGEGDVVRINGTGLCRDSDIDLFAC